MKLDILALAAHPDDTELCIGGILAKHVKLGYKVGIVDLTKGEMGTRGTPDTRAQEAKDATDILGIHVRENLGMPDALFENNYENKLQVIRAIRKYRPNIVLLNAFEDRHPDHGRAFQLSREACFLSGLRKIETENKGMAQEAYRPNVIYSYIQSRFISPDIVVDVSDFWAQKMNAVRAYKTQFYDPNSSEPNTFLSSPEFMKLIEGRGVEYGQAIGAKYGEGLNVVRWIGVDDLTSLL